MSGSKPMWQTVLRLFYDREITPGPGGILYDLQELSKVVADELDIPEQEAEDVLHDMVDFGLLTTEKHTALEDLKGIHDKKMYGLSERGFDVEVQRRQTTAQEETNRFLAVFTAALVLIAMIEALATAPTVSPGASTIIRLVGAVVVVAILVVAWRTA